MRSFFRTIFGLLKGIVGLPVATAEAARNAREAIEEERSVSP